MCMSPSKTSVLSKNTCYVKSQPAFVKKTLRPGIPPIVSKMFYKCFHMTHHSFYFLLHTHFGVILIVSGAFVLHLIPECKLLQYCD